MSQIGTFFRKISLFDATIFDMAPRADSDDEAVFLDSAQDAGVRVEKCMYCSEIPEETVWSLNSFLVR